MVFLLISISLSFNESFIFNGGIVSSLNFGNTHIKFLDISTGIGELVESDDNLYLIGISGTISYPNKIYIEYQGTFYQNFYRSPSTKISLSGAFGGIIKANKYVKIIPGIRIRRFFAPNLILGEIFIKVQVE